MSRDAPEGPGVLVVYLAPHATSAVRAHLRRRDVLLEGRSPHGPEVHRRQAQRTGDHLLDDPVQGACGEGFQGPPEEDQPDVRVHHAGARSVGEEGVEDGGADCVRGEGVEGAPRGQSGCVGEHLAEGHPARVHLPAGFHRDPLARVQGILVPPDLPSSGELGEHAGQGCVHFDPPLLDEREERGGREDLGHRGQVEEGVHPGGRGGCLRVGLPHRAFVDHATSPADVHDGCRVDPSHARVEHIVQRHVASSSPMSSLPQRTSS